MNKHEIIPCERCGSRIECKANAYTKCQCSTVQLSLNEVQYVSENFDGCLCAACLSDLKHEYQRQLTAVTLADGLKSNDTGFPCFCKKF